LLGSGINAQQKNSNRMSWWPAYYLRYGVNKRWTINSDMQVRNFAKDPVLGLLAIRSGAHYRINDQWSVAVGAAWFHQRQLDATSKKIAIDELRLWEELRHEAKLKKWQLVNQFRTEQRHFTNLEGIAYRFRYRLAADFSVSEKWKVLAGNELMWQSSKTRHNWDQYRIWTGGEYSFNEKKQLQLILMNWWQFNSDIHQPVIRVNFVQSIAR
jgi:hypothetical protein